MAFPWQLNIGHMTFDVTLNTQEALAQDANGLCIEDQRRIVLRADLNADKEREVLLHEVLHACFAVANLVLEDDEEEKLVAALTGPLLGTLRANPKLVKFLTHQE